MEMEMKRCSTVDLIVVRKKMKLENSNTIISSVPDDILHEILIISSCASCLADPNLDLFLLFMLIYFTIVAITIYLNFFMFWKVLNYICMNLFWLTPPFYILIMIFLYFFSLNYRCILFGKFKFLRRFQYAFPWLRHICFLFVLIIDGIVI